MAYVVVLDACVLYPASLRDILLRLAGAEFFDLRWSEAVITINLKDFPAEAAEPFGIEVMHPDEFLMVLFRLNEGLVGDIHPPAGRVVAEPAAHRG